MTEKTLPESPLLERQKDTLSDWAQKKGDALYTQIQEQLHSMGQTSLDDLITQMETGAISPTEVADIEQKLTALSNLFILENESRMKMEYAQDLFGKDFFGPEQLEKALGIKIPSEIVPELSCSEAELERAKELGHTLELYIDRLADGTAVTMDHLCTALQPRFIAEGKKNVLYDSLWYTNEDFFNKNTPRLRWRFTAKDILSDSIDMDYLEQTFLLEEYLKDVVFNGIEMPKKYRDAIIELERQRRTLIQKTKDIKESKSDQKELAKELAELHINQLCRQTPVEAIYLSFIYLEMNDERFLETDFTWTTGLSSDSDLVLFGLSGAGGIRLLSSEPDGLSAGMGVCPSLEL